MLAQKARPVDREPNRNAVKVTELALERTKNGTIVEAKRILDTSAKYLETRSIWGLFICILLL